MALEELTSSHRVWTLLKAYAGEQQNKICTRIALSVKDGREEVGVAEKGWTDRQAGRQVDDRARRRAFCAAVPLRGAHHRLQEGLGV